MSNVPVTDASEAHDVKFLVGVWQRTPESVRKRWAAFWSLLIVGMLVATLVIAWANRGQPPVVPDPNYPGAWAQIIFALAVVPLLAVGWLLTNRATANPYGWLWLLLALIVGTQQLIQVLANSLLNHALTAGLASIAVPGPDGYLTGSGTAFQIVRWLGVSGDLLWAAGVVALGFILLLFPDGRLPSPRWNWVARVIGWSFLSLLVVGWFGGGVSGTVPVLRPLALFAQDATAGLIYRVFVDGVLVVTLLLGLVAGVVAVVVRFVRSRGVERQQVTWVMFAGFLFVPTIFWDAPGIWDAVVETAAIAAVPVAVAIAVTRYRLYEIGRILSRTVAYGLLIAVLAGFYFAAIFLLQQLLPVQSDLAVAASTLAVAALFNPIRLRVLLVVDRIFNRGRYNSELVMSQISDRLRDQVNIEHVTTDIRDIVSRVLQPTRLSLWIRS